MATSYTCARDLFEAARDASIDRDAAADQLRKMDARRFSTARRTDGTTSRGTPTDGSGASVAFLDFEKAARRRIAEDDELLRLATAVLFGREGAGGAASLVPARNADVVFQRYVAALQWNKVAAVCGVSPATAKRMAAEVFDVVDAYGVERVVEGVGVAT